MDEFGKIKLPVQRVLPDWKGEELQVYVYLFNETVKASTTVFDKKNILEA